MKQLKILVIDDGSMRLALAAILNIMGHKAMSASSALEGLKCFFEEGDFDAVFVDYHMPDKNGDWVVDKINQSSSSTKKVLMSSDPMSVLSAVARSVGADECLDKGVIGILEMKGLLRKLFPSLPAEPIPAQQAARP